MPIEAPSSVAELEAMTLGGARQWVLTRGRDTTRPLLVKLHGGPGQAEMATVSQNRLLEDDFVVVEWDQRGAGKSAAAFEPVSALTISQLAADANELVEELHRRYPASPVILVGHSWGSVIGLHAVARRPDLYAAYVSTGQIAHFARGQVAALAFARDEAARRGDAKASAELGALGEAPFDGPDGLQRWMRCAKHVGRFGAIWHSDARFDRVRWMLGSIEYSWPEKIRFSAAAARSFRHHYRELLAVDLRAQVPRVEVPVFFASGRHDRLAPVDVATDYLGALDAPQTSQIWFEGSAHFPQWEEPVAFHRFLVDVVLPALR